MLCLASGQKPSDAQTELATKIRSNVVKLWNATWAQGGKCILSNVSSGLTARWYLLDDQGANGCLCDGHPLHMSSDALWHDRSLATDSFSH